MPASAAAGAGIHVNESERVVALHSVNIAMAFAVSVAPSAAKRIPKVWNDACFMGIESISL